MTAAAAPLATILAFTAVASAPFERSLRANLSHRTGVRVTLVSCPRRVPLRARASFTCFVRFASHDRTPVRVRLTDDRGHYTARLRDLLLRHLERQLARAARRKGFADDRFRCPKRRAVAKGDRFTCTGTARLARIQQLGDGRVRYRFET
jgi:hypothetical protein